MPGIPQFAMCFEGETLIEFPAENLTASAVVKRIDDGLYRIDTVPMMVKSANFRDLIQADYLTSGKLRFRRVVEASNWRVFDFLLLRDSLESEEIRRVLLRVERIGGHWERVFSACLLICLPPDVDWNPTTEVSQVARLSLMSPTR
jgi:hypothetical protein